MTAYVEPREKVQHYFRTVSGEKLEATMNQLASDGWEVATPERASDGEFSDDWTLRALRDVCDCDSCRKPKRRRSVEP